MYAIVSTAFFLCFPSSVGLTSFYAEEEPILCLTFNIFSEHSQNAACLNFCQFIGLKHIVSKDQSSREN